MNHLIFRLSRSRLKTNGILDIDALKQSLEGLRREEKEGRKQIVSTVSKEASTSRIQNSHYHKQACDEREVMQSQLASQSKQIADMKEQQQLEMLRRKEEEVRQQQWLEKIYIASTAKKDQGGRVTTSEAELDDVKTGDIFGIGSKSNVITVDASSGAEDVSLLDQPTASTSALTSQSGVPPPINFRGGSSPFESSTSRQQQLGLQERRGKETKTPSKRISLLREPTQFVHRTPIKSGDIRPGNDPTKATPCKENIRPSELNARKQHLRNVAKGIEKKAQAIANDGLDDSAKLNLVPLNSNSYPTSRLLRRSKRRLAQGGR